MSDDALSERHLDRLEELVRRLVEVTFRSADDLWKLQTDLLDLQREIQASIRSAKRAKDKAFLDDLRAILWQARSFGDALAWVFFGYRRQHIYPLGRNSRVPVGQEDAGSRGAMLAALAMAQEGWGFPFLHDITNSLRIGDISFVRPDSSLPTTVEVKSQLVSEDLSDDGTTSVTYNVSILFAPGGPASQMTDNSGVPVLGEAGVQIEKKEPRLTDRVRRQVDRMISAQVHQTASPNTVLMDQGKPFVSLRVDSDHEEHWDVIQRVIASAKQNGYASESVEEAFIYAAFYEADGLTMQAVQRQELVRDVAQSELLRLERQDENRLLITGVPAVRRDGVDFSMPYFLHPFDVSVIIDILRGRLAIVVLSNPGRFAEALRREGFQASVVDNHGAPGLQAETTIADSTGQSYKIELHNLYIPMNEMIREFKSVQYLVNVARSTRDGAASSAAEGKIWGHPQRLRPVSSWQSY